MSLGGVQGVVELWLKLGKLPRPSSTRRMSPTARWRSVRRSKRPKNTPPPIWRRSKKKAERDLEAAGRAAKKAGDDFQKLQADIYEIEKVGAGATLEVWKFGQVLDEAGDTADTVKGLEDVAKKLYEIEKIGAGATLEVWKFGQVIDEAGEAAKVAADKQKEADAKAAKAAKSWATSATSSARSRARPRWRGTRPPPP